jgi:peptide/nickel transport system permease protein
MAEGKAAPIAEKKRRRFLVEVSVRFLREKPLGTVGLVIVLILLLVGIFAELLAPFGYNETLVGGRLESSSWQHWMGTDQSGRDLFSRVVFGARISMFVGLGVSTLSAIISGLIGLISGYLGGKVDLITQRFVDAWMCFPGMFIMITLMALAGPGVPQVVIVLGVLYGITGSRTVRGAVIGIKENVYVEAARSIGSPTGSILTRHILPNIMAPMIIVFTARMGAAILAEASISFLGYGIPEPFPSWGGMLNRGRPYMLEGLHLAVWPGLALTIVVWGINMFGDALRDVLDPRLRGGLGRYSAARKKLPKQTAKAPKEAPAGQ